MNPLKFLFTSGRIPRRICTGPLAGLSIHLDPRAGDLQLWLGLYERETYPALRRLLDGAKAAIDIGAAKGELVLHLLRQPSIERVIAVEPAESELSRLRGNLAANPAIDAKRMIIHSGFAGDGPGPQWRTLDALADGLPTPLFIKIDIDGPEASVLATGRATLANDCRWLIETHSPEAEAGCLTLLREFGYATTVIRPAWWRVVIPEHRPIPHNRWLAAWRPTLG